MVDSLPKQYEPTEVEARWMRFWQASDYFHADETAAKAPFSITLPPPNVTGSLHMGHALGGTLQDILIRWRRMQGFNAMWMPGTDHAGIATQMLVERDLGRRENKSRHDIGRAEFVARVWAWKQKYGGRIVEQLKAMGFSLDWKRERFTMDEASSRAVREAFVVLYEQGLIYRDKRLVNWCVDCHTAVSDLEVDNVEETGTLWELLYPVVSASERITVATTRPETMLGDTAVAVHPDDDRYRHLIGKKVRLPLSGREIPIVADTFVDPAFGSGAVKVTPGHDFYDFECGKRCQLQVLSVISPEGQIIAPAPEAYRGMSVKEARAAVVADLQRQGFLGASREHRVPLGRCERSRTVIEPLVSDQWFVKAEPLAAPAIDAVREGKTRFVPELWTKTYMHWMTNIRDWCISRQLWWGHRIPAWYCRDCGAITVARQEPSVCASCSSAAIDQDEDVLDTWFSSALWPFSTLGWPASNGNSALRTFYPNSVLVTAADIIFFWVARMMMMGLHFCHKVPFRVVYLTPLVMDEHGEKMSKVKGNVVDPLDVVYGATQRALVQRAREEGLDEDVIARIKKEHPKGMEASGADALRFSLAAMTLPGRNIRLSMERITGYRHFVNKLWHAARFALMNFEEFLPERFATLIADGPPPADSPYALALADRWILSRLQRIAKDVDGALSAFRFSEAANTLYHFVWHELCSWYIELAKPHLHRADQVAGQGEVERRRFITQGSLATVLETVLRLLHPFMPAVTEEIWQKVPKSATVPESIMVTLYPQGDDRFRDEAAEREMKLLQDVVVAVRALRSAYNVPPSWCVPFELRVPNDDQRALFAARADIIEHGARAVMTLLPSGGHISQSAKSIVGADIDVVVPLSGLVDIDAEKQRIKKEIGKAQKEIAFVQGKLDNPNFLDRAPPEVVEKERARLQEEETRKKRLSEALEALQ